MKTIPKLDVDAVKATPLPKLGILAVCFLQFSRAFQITVLFPFVVFFVEDSGVTSENNKGFYVGLLAGVFGLCQFLVSVYWGKLGDKIGRRVTLALGLCGSIVSSMVFGFANNYWQGFVARILAGILNGNTAVIRSALSDMTDKTNVGRGFSFLSLMWGAGCTFGPLVGGLLARPNVDSGLFHDYPYLAPFLFGNIIQVLALIFTFLGIPSRKERMRKLEIKNPASVSSTPNDKSDNTNDDEDHVNSVNSTISAVSFGCKHEEDHYCYKCVKRDPILADSVDKKVQEFLKGWFNIGKNGWALAIGSFWLNLAYICFEELVPLFAEESEGGLDMSTSQIGIMLSGGAFFLFLYSVFLVHRLMNKFGILKLMKCVLWSITSAVLLLPLSQWIDNEILRWIFLIFIQCLKHVGATGMFVGHFVLINNVVPPDSLGRANGVLSSISALGNCIGPFFAGIVWAISMRLDFDGRTVLPFIVSSLIFASFYWHISHYPKWIQLPFHEHILTTLGFDTSRKVVKENELLEISIDEVENEKETNVKEENYDSISNLKSVTEDEEN